MGSHNLDKLVGISQSAQRGDNLTTLDGKSGVQSLLPDIGKKSVAQTVTVSPQAKLQKSATIVPKTPKEGMASTASRKVRNTVAVTHADR